MNQQIPDEGNRTPLPNWGPPASRPTAPTAAMLVRDELADQEAASGATATWLQDGLGIRYGRASLIVATGLAAVLLDLAIRSRINSFASLAATVVIALLVFSSPVRRKPSAVAAVLLSVGAITVAVLRSSNWVTAPALAVTVCGLIVASQDLLAKPQWSLAWSNYLLDVAGAARSALDIALRRRSTGAATPSLARAMILTAVVVGPLGLLLASADGAFRGLLLTTADGQVWSHVLLIAAIVPLVAGFAVSARTAHRGPERPVRSHRTLSMMEGSVVLGSVIALLTTWGATQVIVAMGGAERLLATANLTAAENARGGFFQLVTATAILIGVMIASDRLTHRSTHGDRMRFLALTSIIAMETLGLVFATYSRLALYISGFGNTMLRLSVAWFLAWLAAVMVVLVVSINRQTARTGQAGSIIFVMACLWVIAFGLSNPEATVAGTNLDRQQTLVGLDARYLSDALGADAAPLLVERLSGLDADTRRALTADLCLRAQSESENQPTETYGWLSWNRSHARADAAIANLDC